MEDILTQWRSEQLSIASKVIVHTDGDDLVHQLDGYKFIPIQNTITKDLILGGVDISFPPPATTTPQRPDVGEIEVKKTDDDKEKGENQDIKKSIAVYVQLKKNNATIGTSSKKHNHNLTQDMQIIQQDHSLFTLDLPYIPSYLAMRELQPLLKLIRKAEEGDNEELSLEEQQEKTTNTVTNITNNDQKKKKRHRADIILVDGNGIMHERCAGIATCLGVTLNRKTIGVSKTIYCIDGLTKEMLKIGIEKRVWDFLLCCRRRYNDDDSVLKKNGILFDNEQDQKEEENKFVVMCQHAIDAGEGYTMKKSTTSTDDSEEISKIQTQEKVPPLSDLMQELSNYCHGFAIPLKGKSGKIWGAALLGHGGGGRGGRAKTNTHQNDSSSSKKSKFAGTKVPVYVSVGHDVSLQEAICICADVSIARIPEPIRQADLQGREYMREMYS